jgi:hypothetical protein
MSAMDKDTKALLLLTNRMLLDWLSLEVDRGRIERERADWMIDFSADQVVKGAPDVEQQVRWMAELFKNRLPNQE